MIFTHSPLKGVVIIQPELLSDQRGFFARAFCQKEFSEQNLNPTLVQCNISFNLKKGTLRGMHFQAAPHGETKLVRCTMGSIYDVVIDLRPDSPTYKQWFSIQLSAAGRNMLYIPEGVAHGFQTLEDHSEVFYQMSSEYVASAARGLRWNDPSFNIIWPLPVEVISPKDAEYPMFSDDQSINRG